MQVRPAVLDDMASLLDLGEGFFNQTRQAGFTAYEPAAVEKLVTALIDSPTGAVFVAETDDGQCVGTTGGLLYPLWMSPSHLTGQEMFWYVMPEHRKSRAGKMLFDALESWAKEAGAKSFCMLALSHLHEKRVGQMYESKGYVPLERSYIKEL